MNRSLALPCWPVQALVAAAALAAAVPALASPAGAQSPAVAASAPRAVPPAPSDPSDPGARVPPLRHDSVLAPRRGVASAVSPVPWRDANEQVNRIGGWRSYLRESAPSTPSTPAPPPTPASPAAPAPAATPGTGAGR
jgi:hypothetical protein